MVLLSLLSLLLAFVVVVVEIEGGPSSGRVDDGGGRGQTQREGRRASSSGEEADGRQGAALVLCQHGSCAHVGGGGVEARNDCLPLAANLVVRGQVKDLARSSALFLLPSVQPRSNIRSTKHTRHQFPLSSRIIIICCCPIRGDLHQRCSAVSLAPTSADWYIIPP